MRLEGTLALSQRDKAARFRPRSSSLTVGNRARSAFIRPSSVHTPRSHWGQATLFLEYSAFVSCQIPSREKRCFWQRMYCSSKRMWYNARPEHTEKGDVVKLDKNTNYIVSGLERSGTSLLMQMLQAGGIPAAFDPSSRPPDENNPRGYYELEGGKIINKLRDGTFPLADYKGRFIKITSYGLKFLPPGNYKIIYSERNIEEILDSMEKMARIQDENREETKQAFLKLNNMIKERIKDRDDIDVLFVNYNDIILHPESSVEKIFDFLGSSDDDVDEMVKVVDQKLYRNRRM